MVLIAFKSPLIIWFAVKVFDEFNFTVSFNAVCNSSIFVPTLVVPYNKLVPAFIVSAEKVDVSLPVIFPELIVPVVILVVKVNVACLFVSSCPIFVPTLVLPYNKLVAVIVGAVILPELIVPVVILLDEVNVACFVFKLVSILDIFVPTLVSVNPYNKLLDAVIVGAVMVVPVFL